MNETETIIKKAANLTLIASAEEAHNLLADMNSIVADLRMSVNELELKADLFLNELFKAESPIEKTKAFWKISPEYREWKIKAGLLSDVRAVRRLLDRHAELLSSQERFGRKSYERAV